VLERSGIVVLLASWIRVVRFVRDVHPNPLSSGASTSGFHGGWRNSEIYSTRCRVKVSMSIYPFLTSTALALNHYQ
jgi:hypothetical protein